MPRRKRRRRGFELRESIEARADAQRQRERGEVTDSAANRRIETPVENAPLPQPTSQSFHTPSGGGLSSLANRVFGSGGGTAFPHLNIFTDSTAGIHTDNRFAGRHGEPLEADVAIVGGGYSGTASAIYLLNREIRRRTGHDFYPVSANSLQNDVSPSAPPLLDLRDQGRMKSLIMVEKIDERRAGGVAYSSDTANDFHETNIPANRLSVLAGDPNDFFVWWRLKDTFGEIPDNLDYISPNRFKNEPRKLLQLYLNKRFNDIASRARELGIDIQTVEGRVVDAEETSSKVLLSLESGSNLTVDYTLLATGNSSPRKPPFIDQDMLDDPKFDAHYVASQWTDDGQRKIANMDPESDVLIVGTALSGWDAARSLLRQGHRGHITLVSRGGHEHFAYEDENRIDANARTLPEPRCMRYMITDRGRFIVEALQEFRELTGYAIDPNTGSVRRDRGLLGYRRAPYTPEEVLQNWEGHLPRIIREFGADNIGGVMRRFSSLVNTMRVGAGYNISREIQQAKDNGRITVVAANIHDVSLDGDKIDVRWTKKGKTRSEHRQFDHMISSLGANHNYTRTEDPLWRSLIENRGYTSPHRTGIGVSVHQSGLLENCSRIFAAGTLTAGERMVRQGTIGPVAFSVPGMRNSLVSTANSIGSSITNARRLAA